MKIQPKFGALLIISAILMAIFIPNQLFNGQGVSTAQDASPATIQFSGDITAVGVNVIVVNGLTVNISQLDADIEIALGTSVSISGNLLGDGTIIATTVTQVNVNINTDDDDSQGDNDNQGEDEDEPEITETPAPEATEVPSAEVTEEPSVEATEEPSPEATEEPSTGDGDTIIVIEGPVQAININVITIFNIDIEVDADDPILTVIQIGDVIRIEGNLGDFGDRIVIINVINIIFVSVEVYVDVNSGQVWRDSGSCQNGPPPWAPANGWRRKCEGGGGSSPSNNNGGGKKSKKKKS